jgi:glutamyl-tRNA(Gln) amidotransferase subunit D
MNYDPGDLIKIKTKDKVYKGIYIPQKGNSLVIKLESGYNIGIDKKKIKKIDLVKKHKKTKKKTKEIKQNKKLPTISILHTGGTIASKVDYRTGAVHAEFSPEELLKMFPELKDIANIKSRLIFQMFSEDMEPEHWEILAKEVKKEIKKKVDGIIITHGTDTMHYTSAALSFMLQNLPVPLLLVGAQRSSDRGSSDASLNLINASYFISKTNFRGIAICMHENTEDTSCLILPGTKTRKMHTSRRDAFKPINDVPIAKVDYKKKLIENIKKIKENKEKFKSSISFEKNIALIKIRPGFSYKELEFYKNYKGIIFEGTGLGHLAVSVLDKHTKEHKKTLEMIKKLSKKMPIFMTSQCIFGRVDMNVYSSGRDLQEGGVVPLEDMLPETAYVKLGWLLSFEKNQEKIKELMLKNIAGEITERTQANEFL